MRRLYLIIISCCIMLLGCNTYETDSVWETNPSDSNGEDVSQEELTSGASETVTEEIDADSFFTNLKYTLYNCSDGSQIIETMLDNSWAYFRYIPTRHTDGTYEFFRGFYPAAETTYDENGLLEIPFCINDSGDYRWMLKDNTIIFLAEEDFLFNQEYSAWSQEERYNYYSSIPLDGQLSAEEQLNFLKACVYNGSDIMLEKLFLRMLEENPEDRQLLELAMSYGNRDYSLDGNPYQPEIFYGERCAQFASGTVLHIVAKSLQKSQSLEELGCEKIEANLTWQEVWEIDNFQDFNSYANEDARTIGIYKQDLNNDGFREILIVYPGGSSGNIFWDVLFLDEKGLISHIVRGESMNSVDLYRLEQEYFFISPLTDPMDKEFLGWELYIAGQEQDIAYGQVYYEKTGSKIIFDDEHISIEAYYNLDWQIDSFIDSFKSYSYDGIGYEIIPTDEIAELFSAELDYFGNYSGEFGTFDVNNDGIMDWTRTYMFFPSNRHHYYCNYTFIDGKTREEIDLGEYFKPQNFNLRRVIPYQLNGENYFICLGGGPGKYMVKLIEIDGLEILELHSWFVSETKRIIVSVDELTKAVD